MALNAFDRFTQGDQHSVFAGDYECPRHLKYPIQGTVIQLVRLTDELNGLICGEGAMRLFEAQQLVLQVRNLSLHRRFSKKSVFHMGLSSEINGHARALKHPATENAVGWLRIHVDDDNKLCFVDEVQSDAMEVVLEYSRNNQYADAAKEFMKECSFWNLHAFATVYQWAESIGCRAAIHSRESAATVEYMADSERKWRTYYASIIKKFSHKKEPVCKYPVEIFIAE